MGGESTVPNNDPANAAEGSTTTRQIAKQQSEESQGQQQQQLQQEQISPGTSTAVPPQMSTPPPGQEMASMQYQQDGNTFDDTQSVNGATEKPEPVRKGRFLVTKDDDDESDNTPGTSTGAGGGSMLEVTGPYVEYTASGSGAPAQEQKSVSKDVRHRGRFVVVTEEDNDDDDVSEDASTTSEPRYSMASWPPEPPRGSSSSYASMVAPHSHSQILGSMSHHPHVQQMPPVPPYHRAPMPYYVPTPVNPVGAHEMGGYIPTPEPMPLTPSIPPHMDGLMAVPTPPPIIPPPAGPGAQGVSMPSPELGSMAMGMAMGMSGGPTVPPPGWPAGSPHVSGVGAAAANRRANNNGPNATGPKRATQTTIMYELQKISAQNRKLHKMLLEMSQNGGQLSAETVAGSVSVGGSSAAGATAAREGSAMEPRRSVPDSKALMSTTSAPLSGQPGTSSASVGANHMPTHANNVSGTGSAPGGSVQSIASQPNKPQMAASASTSRLQELVTELNSNTNNLVTEYDALKMKNFVLTRQLKETKQQLKESKLTIENLKEQLAKTTVFNQGTAGAGGPRRPSNLEFSSTGEQAQGDNKATPGTNANATLASFATGTSGIQQQPPVTQQQQQQQQQQQPPVSQQQQQPPPQQQQTSQQQAGQAQKMDAKSTAQQQQQQQQQQASSAQQTSQSQILSSSQTQPSQSLGQQQQQQQQQQQPGNSAAPQQAQ